MMSGQILVGHHQGVYVIRFQGDVRVTLSGSFDRYLDAMLGDPLFASVLIDLTGAIAIDSTSLGGLAKLSLEVQARHQKIPTLVCNSNDILRVLTNMGFDDVFAIVDDAYENSQPLAVLPVASDLSEDRMRERVIEAHKTLMSMNEQNRDAFMDLVAALEREQAQASRAPNAADGG